MGHKGAGVLSTKQFRITSASAAAQFLTGLGVAERNAAKLVRAEEACERDIIARDEIVIGTMARDRDGWLVTLYQRGRKKPRQDGGRKKKSARAYVGWPSSVRATPSAIETNRSRH